MSFCCVVTLTCAIAAGEHDQSIAAKEIAQHHAAPKRRRRPEPYIIAHPLHDPIMVAFDCPISDQDPLVFPTRNTSRTIPSSAANCNIRRGTQALLDGAFLPQARFLRNDRPRIKKSQ